MKMKPQFNNGGFDWLKIHYDGKLYKFLIPNNNSKIWTINLANMFGPMLRDEMRLEIKPPLVWLAFLVTYFLDFLAFVFKINRAAFYNHQGFSTNLHTKSEKEEFKEICFGASKEFVKRAIIIRSISEHEILDFDPKFYKIPTRLVFVNNDPQTDLKERSNCKKDLRIMARFSLSLLQYSAPFDDQKIQTALGQYRQLYLSKYSKNSPDFTAEYFKELLGNKVLSFYGIEDSKGNLLAFFALYINGDLATPALVGYDFQSDLPLYRALMTGALKVAAKKGLKLNNSAGAPIFKARRGGKPQIEYMLIYAEHLNFWRKLGYRIFEKLSRLMLPIFRKIAAGEFRD